MKGSDSGIVSVCGGNVTHVQSAGGPGDRWRFRRGREFDGRFAGSAPGFDWRLTDGSRCRENATGIPVLSHWPVAPQNWWKVQILRAILVVSMTIRH